LFQGQLLQIRRCAACTLAAPSSGDPFVLEELHCASLAPHRQCVSLLELLNAASAVETPKGYRCDRCQTLDTTVMMSGLVRLPQIYVLRLNRVAFDTRGGESRVGCSVDFPDTLDLVLVKRLLWPDRAPLDYHGRPCGTKYRLFAVVFHEGSQVRRGHYFSYIRGGDGTGQSGGRGKSRRAPGGAFTCCADQPTEIAATRSSSSGSSSRRDELSWTLVSDASVTQMRPPSSSDGRRSGVASPQMVEMNRQRNARACLLFYSRVEEEDVLVEESPEAHHDSLRIALASPQLSGFNSGGGLD